MEKYFINTDIRAKEVRVISDSGEQFGILPIKEALLLAEGQNKDLVLMPGNSTPAVCKIIDFGKFKFDTEKKIKEQKKNQPKNLTKEIQLGVTIQDHDLNIKITRAIEFLNEGCKVQFKMKLKGRENGMNNVGADIFAKVISSLNIAGAIIEKNPVRDGKTIIMNASKKK